MSKNASRTSDHLLGAVQPLSARHLLAKLLALEPSKRAPLDEVARHAWLVGGLDTIELHESYAGLQQAQQLTQRQLATVQAELRGQRKLEKEEALSRERIDTEAQKRKEAKEAKRRSVLSAAADQMGR